MTQPDDVPFGMHETNLAPWERNYAKRLDEPGSQPPPRPVAGQPCGDIVADGCEQFDPDCQVCQSANSDAPEWQL